jgi:anti-sigma factor RsiW
VSEHDRISCEQFDGRAEELALGQLDDPERSRFLAHAADCPRCHSLFEGLGTVVDRLLLAAPQVEPPAGFEGRVLARLDTAESRGPHRSSRLGTSIVLAGSIAAALMIVVTVMVIRGDGGSSTAAAIVASGGGEVGSVELIAEPTAHVLVVIDAPRPGPGRRACELRRPDGSWTTVGWWDAADIASGVWAVGIDPALLDATAMRITLDGDVLATATFD